MAFSFFGCASKPIQACIINAPNQNRECFDLSSDYNDDGTLKASAIPVYKPNAMIQDLNKALIIDSPTGFEDGLANLKAYIKDLRDAYNQCMSNQ